MAAERKAGGKAAGAAEGNGGGKAEAEAAERNGDGKAAGAAEGNGDGKEQAAPPENTPEAEARAAEGTGDGEAEAPGGKAPPQAAREAAAQGDEFVEKEKEKWTQKKAADWAAFQRSLKADSSGRSRVSKCPTDIALKIKNAESVAEKAELTANYFKAWQESDRDWATVTMSQRKTATSSAGSSGGMHWQTEDELLKIYSEEVVSAFKKQKKADPEMWRPHPDAPDCEKAVQYWVSSGERSSWAKEKKEENEVCMDSELEKGAAEVLLPMIGGGAASQPAVNPVHTVEGGGKGKGRGRGGKPAETEEEKQARLDAARAKKDLPESKLKRWVRSRPFVRR